MKWNSTVKTCSDECAINDVDLTHVVRIFVTPPDN